MRLGGGPSGSWASMTAAKRQTADIMQGPVGGWQRSIPTDGDVGQYVHPIANFGPTDYYKSVSYFSKIGSWRSKYGEGRSLSGTGQGDASPREHAISRQARQRARDRRPHCGQDAQALHSYLAWRRRDG